MVSCRAASTFGEVTGLQAKRDPFGFSFHEELQGSEQRDNVRCGVFPGFTWHSKFGRCRVSGKRLIHTVASKSLFEGHRQQDIPDHHLPIYR